MREFANRDFILQLWEELVSKYTTTKKTKHQTENSGVTKELLDLHGPSISNAQPKKRHFPDKRM